MNTSTASPQNEDAVGATLKIGDALSIYSVESVRAACMTELNRATSLIVDLAEVSSCDSVGIQVLLAAQRSAKNGGKTLRFANIPTAVSQAAERAGCAKLFSNSSR